MQQLLYLIFYKFRRQKRIYKIHILCPNIMNENELELSKETIKEVQRARKEYKKGNFVTEEEVRKRLGL